MKQLLCLSVAAALLAPLPALTQDANPVVVMDTNMGTIKIELYPKKAPKTVKNFLAYVEAKQYDDTIFHRVIPNFMVQAGGFSKEKKEKMTNPPIPDEVDTGLINERGTLSMANRGPNTGTAQFFINLKHNDHLDGKHAVFGKVVEGMDLVEKISKVQTGKTKFMVSIGDGNKYVEATFSDVPVEPVIVKTVRVVKK